jgi:hypothetical protein
MAGRLAMSLAPPPEVRKLQDALHSKAKGAPGYRFYALYDKLYRDDILRFAYERCQANGGAPGVDGQNFAGIEVKGLEAWLGELTEELRKETYRPQPVRPGPVSLKGPTYHTRLQAETIVSWLFKA